MGRYIRNLYDAFRKCDKVLLLLCIITTIFGCLIVASSTNSVGNLRFMIIQIAAACIGVILYAVVSSVDAEYLAEQRVPLVIFNCFLLLLLIPFGESHGGNRSWLKFPLIPFNIQVAEICKITFILIMASVMNAHQNKLSSIRSVMHMVLHLAILGVLNVVLSGDAGVTLIFVFIFIGMAFAGGVSLYWFIAGIGGLAAVFPILWKFILHDYQKIRIEVLYNPDLDPAGTGPRFHAVQSLRSLTGGGMDGQGLFSGHRTQQNALFAQHTDYIFSSIGEELGFIGCIFVMVMMCLIIARCIWVGCHSQDYLRRLICFGAASAMIFQVISNIGMCIGITPVIGLTLPFISYGGSSLVTLYGMLGLVSGVYARPSPASHELYIRPPYMTRTLR